ncbi:MAG: transglutaminase-like cysteine peptidase, partial [Proteobacteria bacterium]|nr:transglutaminase-like cysteine peptidase [Pseudomonadota bacterium]
GLPGMAKEDGTPRYPGGYADYIVNHERAPGIGPLAGWRGADGQSHGKGAVNPAQLQRYIENGCFWSHHLPEDQKFYKFANKAYLDWSADIGFIGKAEPIVLQVYSEVMQKFRLAARGHGRKQPPERERARIEAYFDPLPIWYQPFEHAMVDLGENDYWATPAEFMTRFGDCEDYAIIKYLSLRRLGWQEKDLRVVAVKDMNLKVGHAVLVVFFKHPTSGQIMSLLLDNQIKQIVQADRVRHYQPVFSLNQFHWWRHTPVLG